MKEITRENINQLSGEYFKDYALKVYSEAYKFAMMLISIIIVSALKSFPGEAFSLSFSFMLCAIFWAIFMYLEKDVYEYIGEHSKIIKLAYIQRRLDYLRDTYIIPLNEERDYIERNALITLVSKNHLGIGHIINETIKNPSLATDYFPTVKPLLEKCILEEYIAFNKREENVTNQINKLNNLLTVIKKRNHEKSRLYLYFRGVISSRNINSNKKYTDTQEESC